MTTTITKTVTKQEPSDAMPQFRASVGTTSFMRADELSERFGYTTYELQFAYLPSPHDPASLYIAVGGSGAHADESSLGSKRFAGGLEIGFRGFIPVVFLDRIILETGLSGDAGYSQINFGGGDNPEGAFDAQVAVNGRMMIDLDILSLGVGAVIGYSPTRSYAELGFNGFLAVPLSSVERKKISLEEDDCDNLLTQEAWIHQLDAKTKGVHADVQALRKEIEVRQEENRSRYDAYVRYRAQMVKEGFSCKELLQGPASSETPKPVSMPPWPTGGTCEELYTNRQTHGQQLISLHEDFTRAKGKLEEAIDRAQQFTSKLQSYDPDCTPPIPSTQYTVKGRKGLYRLNPNILFENDNPDLSFGPQKDHGVAAGSASAELDEWIRFLQEHPNYKITVDGYASEKHDPNTRYDESDMLRLATRRARNVVWHLLNRARAHAVYVFDCDNYSGKCNAKKGQIDLSGPFVPPLVSQPLTNDRFLHEPQGHGKEGLFEYARSFNEVTKKLSLNVLWKIASDPVFRAVRIRVYEEKDGKWQEVPIKEIGTLEGEDDA